MDPRLPRDSTPKPSRPAPSAPSKAVPPRSSRVAPLASSVAHVAPVPPSVEHMARSVTFPFSSLPSPRDAAARRRIPPIGGASPDARALLFLLAGAVRSGPLRAISPPCPSSPRSDSFPVLVPSPRLRLRRSPTASGFLQAFPVRLLAHPPPPPPPPLPPLTRRVRGPLASVSLPGRRTSRTRGRRAFTTAAFHARGILSASAIYRSTRGCPRFHSFLFLFYAPTGTFFRPPSPFRFPTVRMPRRFLFSCHSSCANPFLPPFQ